MRPGTPLHAKIINKRIPTSNEHEQSLQSNMPDADDWSTLHSSTPVQANLLPKPI